MFIYLFTLFSSWGSRLKNTDPTPPLVKFNEDIDITAVEKSVKLKSSRPIQNTNPGTLRDRVTWRCVIKHFNEPLNYILSECCQTVNDWQIVCLKLNPKNLGVSYTNLRGSYKSKIGLYFGRDCVQLLSSGYLIWNKDRIWISCVLRQHFSISAAIYDL